MAITKYFIFLCLLSHSLFAGEGFDDRRFTLPGSALQALWDATFAVDSKGGGFVGSAFFIRKQQGRFPGEYYFYFLTSGHVINANCGPNPGTCNRIQLTSGQSFNRINGAITKTSDRQMVLDKIEISKISKQPDLALLKVTVDSSAFFSSLQPAVLHSTCSVAANSKAYVIGFPGTYHRSKTKGTNESNIFLNIKRWSQGDFLGDLLALTEGDSEPALYSALTADSLSGNSGGPAATADGQVIGVLDSSLGVGALKNIYVGNESSSPQQGHSLLERCQAVKTFLAAP